VWGLNVLRKLAISVLIFLIAGAAGLYLGQRSFFYPAPQEQLATPPAGYQFVETKTSDGLTLRAAYRPAADGKATLLFFHGNGDSIEGAGAATQMLTDAGYGAFLVEYRGYGGNPGSPSEDGFYRDGEAAIKWLARNAIASKDIVIVGNSIGSGAATEMALRHNPKALVLVSAFASLPYVVSDLYPILPAQWLARDRYDNVAKLGRIKSPILILHGDSDNLVRPANAYALAKSAPNAKRIMVAGKGHELAYLPEGQRPNLAWLESLQQRF
jgi:pimeloyl-ACP methyl ester carboxylesterase